MDGGLDDVAKLLDTGVWACPAANPAAPVLNGQVVR